MRRPITRMGLDEKLLTRLPIALLMIMFFAAAASAETFEFVSFSPPKGWSKEAMADGIAYRRQQGIGLIAIYASQPATGNTKSEFAKVWTSRLQSAASGTAPQPQIKRDGDFSIAIGAQRVNTKDGITALLLVTFVGRGRALSIMSVSMGDGVQGEITSFLDSLSIVESAEPTFGTGRVEVDFAVPAGYLTQYEGQTVILRPSTTNDQTPCVYAIASPRPSTGSLESDALRALLEPLPGWQRKGERHDSFRGVGHGGWQYFIVRADVQALVNGSYQSLSAVAMAFPATKGMVNIIWGFGSLSGCTGEDLPFARLISTVQPRGVSGDGGKAFTQALTGIWQNSQGSGIGRYKFLPGGRYEYGQSTSTTLGISERRSSSVNDGSWSLNGSELTLRPERRDLGVKRYLVRIFEKNIAGRWWRMMFLLDESVNPPLDVRFERIVD